MGMVKSLKFSECLKRGLLKRYCNPHMSVEQRPQKEPICHMFPDARKIKVQRQKQGKRKPSIKWNNFKKKKNTRHVENVHGKPPMPCSTQRQCWWGLSWWKKPGIAGFEEYLWLCRPKTVSQTEPCLTCMYVCVGVCWVCITGGCSGRGVQWIWIGVVSYDRLVYNII